MQRRDGQASGPELTTNDPIVIVERGTEHGVEWIDYECRSEIGVEHWRIIGVCNQCGMCEVGVIGDTRGLVWFDMAGMPGACSDPTFATRRDIPMRPEGVNETPECSLSGWYW